VGQTLPIPDAIFVHPDSSLDACSCPWFLFLFQIVVQAFDRSTFQNVMPLETHPESPPNGTNVSISLAASQEKLGAVA
jgi:hypothetical protein